MTTASRTKIFSTSSKKLFDVIADIEKYPEFVPGVHGITLISRDKNKIRAEYQLNIIKTFKYVIDIELHPNDKVSWSLVSGDIFKKNSGSWLLKELNPNQTEVTYNIEVEFKIFAPGMIVGKLVDGNLPQMLDAFEQRAKGT